MAGTKQGGLNAAQTNKQKYGNDFYKNIGKIGGTKGTTANGSIKGFAANKELAREAGRVGGMKSRRRKR